MTDLHLIAAIRSELTFVASRGFPKFAANVTELVKRLENLTACHAALAQREERLTQQLVKLTP